MTTRRRRIAIVVTHFEPKAQYIENILAQRLTQYLDVRVITSSSKVSAFAEVANSERPMNASDSFQVVRVEPLLEFRHRVYSKDLRNALVQSATDALVIVGPSQVLPLQAFAYARNARVPVVVIAGENEQQGPAGALAVFSRRFYARTVLRTMYRWLAKHAAAFVALTPETLSLTVTQGHRSTAILKALPFDERIVRYSSAQGKIARERHGWPSDEPIFLFVGKFERRKSLDCLIAEFEEFAGQCQRGVLVLVGSGHGAYSEEIKRQVAASRHVERIYIEPFMSQEELVGVMSAADVSIWPHVSAGITQSMGAGVYALTRKSNVSDFLTEGTASRLGEHYRADRGGLAAILSTVDIRALRETRLARARLARELYSAQRFCDVVFAAIDSRTSPKRSRFR